MRYRLSIYYNQLYARLSLVVKGGQAPSTAEVLSGEKVTFFCLPGSQTYSIFCTFAMESAMYKIHTKIHV